MTSVVARLGHIDRRVFAANFGSSESRRTSTVKSEFRPLPEVDRLDHANPHVVAVRCHDRLEGDGPAVL